jgi:putative transcriptional regulator
MDSKGRKNRILQGAREALDYVKGNADQSRYHINIPAEVDVAKLRGKLKLSQPEFAAAFGFTVDAIRSYEQGRSTPTGPVRAYLTVIEKNPKAVEKALEDA